MTDLRNTHLSPAAYAVVQAAHQADYVSRPGIAAALRAAADQVVPFEATAPWDELKFDYDGDHWEMRQWVRDRLLAIAAELESHAVTSALPLPANEVQP